MPDVALNGIEFTIKSNTKDAISSIDKLRRSLSKLAKSDFATPLRALADEMEDFAESVNKLDTGNLSSFTKGLKGIMDISKKVHESFADYDDGFKRMVGYLQGIGAIDLSNLEGAAQNLRDIVAAAKALQNAQGNGGVETVVGEPDFLRTALSGIADSAKSAASAVGKFALNFVTFPFRKIGSGLKSLNGKLGNIIGSLKRIAFYRIIRSVIKAITQAFQEGLKNAYEFSKATGDQAGLANALDTLSTKSLTMKNQLGAAFGQLLTAITPIVVQIIGWVNKLAEALTRLIAILGGSDTYLRAKDVWTEWGEAAAGAGGAAKKALEYLAPFDELNVLPDPKSGGGGGGSTPNYGDMFEYVNTSEGNGFLDTIKDMLDRVSNFFETKDWAALADTAWQKLKEAFSDDGKATEVIRSLFEALGSAIGAASAFVGEFCYNLVSNIITKFKANLHDYNGDGKISVLEIIEAAVLTSVEASQSLTNWVKTNIVDPFFDGFSKAIGMSGKEELYDAIVNLGIDIANGFINNVINPLKEKWNEFADWLYEKTHGKVDWRVEMTAEIAHVNTAGLTASQKVISGMTAGLTAVKNGLTTDQKTISVTAKITKKTVGLDDSNTSHGRQVVTTARFTSSKNALNKDQRTITAWAKFTSRIQGLNKDQRTFSSWANFTARKQNLSEDQRTFSSWAKFNDYKNALGTPLLNSNAYISDYRIDSSIKYYGNLSVDAYVNIKGQTNTPTVAVNAYYTNQTKAKGGAYYGSMWHDIPQYASGGRPHGSLFLAGEAGPEVVGHVGGRTEVLNRSQLAATMYSAVRSAMASTGFRISASPSPAYSTSDGAGNEDALYRAFRRALDETDFGGDVELDGQTLYRAMVNRNRQNTRLTGVNAMA